MEKRMPRWWALVFYCGISTLAAALGLAVLFAGATAVFAYGQPAQDAAKTRAADSPGGQTFQGVVTDDHCGARHKDQQKTPADCARICVRDGSSYALVDGDKTYKLEGNDADLARFAGQRIELSGSMRGDTINVSRIVPLQQ